MRQYSPLFQTIVEWEEQFSILRCIHFARRMDYTTPIPMWQDFVLLWDADHDTRIINLLERLYLANQLWGIVGIGETKGIALVYHTREGVVDISPFTSNQPDPWFPQIEHLSACQDPRMRAASSVHHLGTRIIKPQPWPGEILSVDGVRDWEGAESLEIASPPTQEVMGMSGIGGFDGTPDGIDGIDNIRDFLSGDDRRSARDIVKQQEALDNANAPSPKWDQDQYTVVPTDDTMACVEDGRVEIKRLLAAAVPWDPHTSTDVFQPPVK